MPAIKHNVIIILRHYMLLTLNQMISWQV